LRRLSPGWWVSDEFGLALVKVGIHTPQVGCRQFGTPAYGSLPELVSRAVVIFV